MTSQEIPIENFSPSVRVNLVQLIHSTTGAKLWMAQLPGIALRFYGPSPEFCFGLIEQRFPKIKLTTKPHGDN